MTYTVLVLGCGPAGYYAALACARAGLRTAISEKEGLGGTGLRWGCLPVKMVLDELRGARSRGSRRSVLRRTAARLKEVERGLGQTLGKAGVEIIRGEASLLDSHTASVDGTAVKAENIVLATGTRPAAPPGIELDGRFVISHADFFRRTQLPRRAAVVGGDVEGVEFACLLAGLGAEVELLEKENEILPGQDRDLVRPVEERLAARAVRFRLGAAAAGVEPRKGAVLLADGSALRAEVVLVTGLRRPNLPEGLEAAGVAFTPERIPVDSSFRTNVPHIYAIGDVNGLAGMAHAAIQQGMLLPEALRGGQPAPQSYPSLPRAIFTIPEIAGAGLQERELERRGIPYERSSYALPDTWRGISKRIREGFLKLLAGRDRRLLGIWVCAENASELAAPFACLLDRGAGVDELLRSLFIHPSLGESLLEAAWRIGG